MSLRFVLLISWSMPLALLGWILYHEYATETQPIVETNARMRVRMCREHIVDAKANRNDAAAMTAIEQCTADGYISQKEVELALD